MPYFSLFSALAFEHSSTEADLYHFRIEGRTRFGPQIFEHFRIRPGLPVRPVGGERIPHINNGEDACRERYLFAFQTARITGAVPFLMMAVGDIDGRLQVTNGGKHLEGQRTDPEDRKDH